MDTENYNLIGHSTNKMDAKGRVSIKSEWREKIGKLDLLLMKSTSEGQDVLRLLTQTEFQNLKELIDSHDCTPAVKRKLSRKLFMSCLEVRINEQSKLTVPKVLQDEVGIAPGEELKLIANNNYIEILSIGNFAKTEASIQEEVDAVNDELGIF